MKTAFVTGASSGFGRAICRTLIGKGYRVAVCDARGNVLARSTSNFGRSPPRANRSRNASAWRMPRAERPSHVRSPPTTWRTVTLDSP